MEAGAGALTCRMHRLKASSWGLSWLTMHLAVGGQGIRQARGARRLFMASKGQTVRRTHHAFHAPLVLLVPPPSHKTRCLQPCPGSRRSLQ